MKFMVMNLMKSGWRIGFTVVQPDDTHVSTTTHDGGTVRDLLSITLNIINCFIWIDLYAEHTSTVFVQMFMCTNFH